MCAAKASILFCVLWAFCSYLYSDAAMSPSGIRDVQTNPELSLQSKTLVMLMQTQVDQCMNVLACRCSEP